MKLKRICSLNIASCKIENVIPLSGVCLFFQLFIVDRFCCFCRLMVKFHSSFNKMLFICLLVRFAFIFCLIWNECKNEARISNLVYNKISLFQCLRAVYVCDDWIRVWIGLNTVVWLKCTFCVWCEWISYDKST